MRRGRSVDRVRWVGDRPQLRQEEAGARTDTDLAGSLPILFRRLPMISVPTKLTVWSRFHQDVQLKVKAYILGTDMSNFKYDDFIVVLDVISRYCFHASAGSCCLLMIWVSSWLYPSGGTKHSFDSFKAHQWHAFFFFPPDFPLTLCILALGWCRLVRSSVAVNRRSCKSPSNARASTTLKTITGRIVVVTARTNKTAEVIPRVHFAGENNWYSHELDSQWMFDIFSFWHVSFPLFAWPAL